MAFLKRLPFTSLGLLLLSYASFGWLMAEFGNPVIAGILALVIEPAWSVAWATIITPVVAGIVALILAGVFTAPPRSLRSRLLNGSTSSTDIFLGTSFVIFLAIMILYLTHILFDLVLLMTAMILAKLDLQVAKFTYSQTFLMLMLFSLIGISSGWIIHELSAWTVV